MRFEALLPDLLYEHDCVIIPGFGGLVANYRSAKLNERTHLISPPSKQVGFNRNLVHNDGLLCNYVSQIAGCTYSEANQKVTEWVGQLKTILRNKQRIDFEKIGFIFHDKSGNLQFVPENRENFLPSSYGLIPIQLKQLMAIAEPSKDVHVLLHPAARKQNYKPWMAAAAIALPVILAGSLLLGNQLNKNGQLSFVNGISFFKKATISLYNPRPEIPVWQHESIANNFEKLISENPDLTTIQYDFTADSVSAEGITVEVKPNSPDTPVKVENSTTENLNIESGKKEYAIIAGAFQIEENAEKLLSQLREKGFDAQPAGQAKNLHYVAFGFYETKKEALDALRIIRDKGAFKAWIRKN